MQQLRSLLEDYPDLRLDHPRWDAVVLVISEDMDADFDADQQSVRITVPANHRSVGGTAEVAQHLLEHAIQIDWFHTSFGGER